MAISKSEIEKIMQDCKKQESIIKPMTKEQIEKHKLSWLMGSLPLIEVALIKLCEQHEINLGDYEKCECGNLVSDVNQNYCSLCGKNLHEPIKTEQVSSGVVKLELKEPSETKKLISRKNAQIDRKMQNIFLIMDKKSDETLKEQMFEEYKRDLVARHRQEIAELEKEVIELERLDNEGV